jgi:hypothetical protein
MRDVQFLVRQGMSWNAVLRIRKYFFRLRLRVAINPNYGSYSSSVAYTNILAIWISFVSQVVLSDTLKITFFDLYFLTLINDVTMTFFQLKFFLAKNPES